MRCIKLDNGDIPTGVPAELYDANHPLADWMWIVDTSASTKARYGLPPTDSNYIVCQLPNHLPLPQLTQLVHTEAPSTQVLRTFTGAFITFNCNSLKEGDTPTQDAGVTCSPTRPCPTPTPSCSPIPWVPNCRPKIQ